MVIDSDEAACEGEYFAEGDEQAAVDDADGWYGDACGEQSASEDAESHRKHELPLSVAVVRREYKHFDN